MCANYLPVTRSDRMLQFFGVRRDRDAMPADVWPLGMAPFIRLSAEGMEGGLPGLVVDDGQFGLLPHFATEVAYGRRTYNARSETVAKLASFRDAWRSGQRCIIPSEAIYEPCYESGKAVRWRISQVGDVPMGIAGVYRAWHGPDGAKLWTFAMLTVNADGHAVMQRFHKPGDEKRMVVILAPADYGAWLSCPIDEAPRFFTRWSGPLQALAAPLPPRPRS